MNAQDCVKSQRHKPNSMLLRHNKRKATVIQSNDNNNDSNDDFGFVMEARHTINRIVLVISKSTMARKC